MLLQGSAERGFASRRGHQRCILLSRQGAASSRPRVQGHERTRVTTLPVTDEVSRTHLLPTAVSALQSSQEQAAHCHI